MPGHVSCFSTRCRRVRWDLIARRATQDVTQLMFRLFVLYQPGGSSERGRTLAQLQTPPQGTTVVETLEILRGWPRHLRRCQQLGMSAPDPTVLAKGVDMATSKVISGSPDAHFRTQLLRTSLRLDAKPTLRNVEDYQRHLQAEVEQMAAAYGRQSKDQGNLHVVWSRPNNNSAAFVTYAVIWKRQQ